MLLYNALRTPDGTLLVSRHRHDYVTHTDTITGHKYMVDGGLDYSRRSMNGDEVDCSLTTDSPHEQVRECVSWGSYGKDGHGPFRLILLKDLEDDHIKAILATQHHMYDALRVALIREQQFRQDHRTMGTDPLPV